MDIKIIIKRQKDSRSAPYPQEFTYTGDGRLTVADFLSELNTRMPLLTADGKETEKINYASSCQEKKCGACAMLINGLPRLACSLFLCNIVKKGKIELAPLSKFPVISDLRVDREKIFARLKENYEKYFFAGCSQSLSCVKICPLGLPLDRIQSRANHHLRETKK